MIKTSIGQAVFFAGLGRKAWVRNVPYHLSPDLEVQIKSSNIFPVKRHGFQAYYNKVDHLSLSRFDIEAVLALNWN